MRALFLALTLLPSLAFAWGFDGHRKLASLSDNQIEKLVSEHASIGYGGDPLLVIAGSLVLLVLFVLVVVALVD